MRETKTENEKNTQ